MPDSNLELIRHFLSTLFYRTNKIISNCPQNYPDLQIGKGVRSPREILNHIVNLLLFTKSYLLNNESESSNLLEWDDEVERFKNTLQDLDKVIFNNENIDVARLKKILQGPLSDAMTHTGQLALLRRMADSPIPGENFMKAIIEEGKF